MEAFYAALARLPDGDTSSGWAPLTATLDKLGVRWKAVRGNDLFGLIRATHPWHEVAPGSPFMAVHAYDTLFFSDRCSTTEVAHEVGHAVVWVRDGRPDGINWGLGDTGGDPEIDATAVQMCFMHYTFDTSLYDVAIECYTSGIGSSYDPDDEDEAEYALYEVATLIESGRKILALMGVP